MSTQIKSVKQFKTAGERWREKTNHLLKNKQSVIVDFIDNNYITVDYDKNIAVIDEQAILKAVIAKKDSFKGRQLAGSPRSYAHVLAPQGGIKYQPAHISGTKISEYNARKFMNKPFSKGEEDPTLGQTVGNLFLGLGEGEEDDEDSYMAFAGVLVEVSSMLAVVGLASVSKLAEKVGQDKLAEDSRKWSNNVWDYTSDILNGRSVFLERGRYAKNLNNVSNGNQEREIIEEKIDRNWRDQERCFKKIQTNLHTSYEFKKRSSEACQAKHKVIDNKLQRERAH